MLSDNEQLARILDRELIGFLTAVAPSGQPQTAPVWFVRDGDDIVVYNQPNTPRLASIAVNPKVALTLRGDPRGMGGVSIEASAARDDTMPSPSDFPGYLDKYAAEIELIGYTPEQFSVGYRTGVRLTVNRVRAFGLEHLDS
jgi:PPOX class probable F420-dependent enzyme